MQFNTPFGTETFSKNYREVCHEDQQIYTIYLQQRKR